METTAIQRAVKVIGGQTGFARQIGRTQGLVWQWCAGRCAVPAEYCLSIERMVDRQVDESLKTGVMTHAEAEEMRVTRYQLRPDVFGGAPTRDLREAG